MGKDTMRILLCSMLVLCAHSAQDGESPPAPKRRKTNPPENISVRGFPDDTLDGCYKRTRYTGQYTKDDNGCSFINFSITPDNGGRMNPITRIRTPAPTWKLILTEKDPRMDKFTTHSLRCRVDSEGNRSLNASDPGPFPMGESVWSPRRCKCPLGIEYARNGYHPLREDPDPDSTCLLCKGKGCLDGEVTVTIEDMGVLSLQERALRKVLSEKANMRTGIVRQDLPGKPEVPPADICGWIFPECCPRPCPRLRRDVFERKGSWNGAPATCQWCRPDDRDAWDGKQHRCYNCKPNRESMS